MPSLIRILAMIALLPLLGGCDDAYRKREAARLEKVKKENARARVERAAEEKLVRAALAETIEKRLSEWLSVRDGLFVLPAGWKNVTKPDRNPVGLVAMPVTTPWYVRCDRDGVSIVIGPWSE